MSAADDARLVRRAQSGDRAAAGQLVEQYRRPVFALCLHLLDSVEEAQDATQDAFVRAWRSLGQLRDAQAFPAWLATIARRECGQRRRRPSAASLGDAPDDAQGDIDGRLERERLRERLGFLPPDTRLIYLLSCLDGLTSRRIGAFLGMSAGAVRARLHRARKRLRGALQEPADGAACEALGQLEPEVIPVSIGIASAGGPWPETPFADDMAVVLYGYVYGGAALDEAARRAGIDEALAESYRRTWEECLIVKREGGAVRPLLPVKLQRDRPAVNAWQERLADHWIAAARARRAQLKDIATRAAGEGWLDSARDAAWIWLPAPHLFGALHAEGLYLPPMVRPSGACHLFGHEHGGEDAEASDYAFGDPQTGDNTFRLSALTWWACKGSPEAAKGLNGGTPHNPLPRILVSFREQPATRGEALTRLEEAAPHYLAPGEGPADLLERLVGWRVLSAEEPHRLLLPAFVGDLACEAHAVAKEIAAEVGQRAAETRGTLEELIRGSSFAACNRSDVYHLMAVGVMFAALRRGFADGHLTPLPAACFADRGPYIYERV